MPESTLAEMRGPDLATHSLTGLNGMHDEIPPLRA